MAYTEIINITYDLVDELKESFYYKEMIKLDNIIKTKYKKELENYQKAFVKFDEVFSYGNTYHPDYKKVTKEYQEAKKELFSKEEVKKYFEYETKINELLSSLSEEICSTVSKYSKKGGSCSWI